VSSGSASYGYGNAIWPQDGVDDDEDGGAPGGQPKELLTKPWRPLTRKLRITAAVISPYRYRNLNPTEETTVQV
jgi:cellulose synthase-like protein